MFPELKSDFSTFNGLDSSVSVRNFLINFEDLLNEDGITEICINEPGTAYVEKFGSWEERKNNAWTYELLFNLGQAAAKYRENVFDELRPILSVTLPDGERAQFVMPPVTSEGKISLTIRRPSFAVRKISTYVEDGFFKHIRPSDSTDPNKAELDDLYSKLQDKHIDENQRIALRPRFLQRCVELNQNIVIAGGTGSGKTTFMKALMQFIPHEQRIITIEDVPELQYGLNDHKNQVNLFYPSEAVEGDLVTAASLLRSCLRMKPDRILLAELRGGETYDFLNVCMSGHGGSITSCHSGSCEAAFDYLAMKVLQNPTGSKLSYEQISYLLKQVINVVVHIQNSHDIGRHITGIYYNS